MGYLRRRGRLPCQPGEDMSPWVNYVSPGFFATLKIPLYAGRDFTEQDAAASPRSPS